MRGDGAERRRACLGRKAMGRGGGVPVWLQAETRLTPQHPNLSVASGLAGGGEAAAVRSAARRTDRPLPRDPNYDFIDTSLVTHSQTVYNTKGTHDTGTDPNVTLGA